MLPGGFEAPSFIFTYGAAIIFVGLYIIFKAYEVLVQKKPLRFMVPAKEIDLETNLPYIEALTAASEAHRATHEKSRGKKLSDFFF